MSLNPIWHPDWEHDGKTLAEKKLFNPLPLLLFTLRAELDAIKIKCPEHMHAGLIKAQQMTDNIICILEQIHNKEKLFFDDLNQIMHALSHLAHYLDRRYEWNGRFGGGADIMIKKVFWISNFSYYFTYHATHHYAEKHIAVVYYLRIW